MLERVRLKNNYFFEKNGLNTKYTIAKVNGKHGLYSRNYQTVIPFQFINLQFKENKDVVYCETENRKVHLLLEFMIVYIRIA